LANTTPGQDEIILAAGTYDISAYTGTRDNDFKSVNGVVTNGLPVIKTDIIIRGASADTTFITRNGTATYRLFHVAAGATLTLRKLTLSKGNVGTQDIGGGAVEVFGTGLFEDCRFGPDNKSNYGGAIVNGGTTTIERCDIFKNEADWGGGVYNADGGTMKIYNTLIANNKAITNSGVLYYAGGVYNSNNLLIDHCCILGNQANRGGGVMSNRVVAQTTIKRSIISNNDAQEGAGVYSGFGPITVEDTTLMDNTGWSGRIAFRRDAQPITLTRCHFPDNYVEVPAQGSIYPNDLWYVTVSNVKYPWRAKFKMLQTSAQQLLEPVYEYEATNRAAASDYAAQVSQNNFNGFARSLTGDARGTGTEQRIVNGNTYANVGGRFEYRAANDLAHKAGSVTTNSTGSSIFVSEMLHLGGGMPITLGINGTTDCAIAGSNAFETGWRVCRNGQATLVERVTQPWKRHETLKDYFAQQPVPNTYLRAVLSIDDLNRMDHLNFGTYAGTIRFGTLAEFRAQAYAIFNGQDAATDSNLRLMDTGDYIFVNLGSGQVSHGFLIVGWGTAVECPAGLNAPKVAVVNTNSIAGQYQLTRIQNTVPYVVDFGYSYNETEGKTGWLQDPRPRPFYCSALTISSNNTTEINPHLARLGFSSGTLNDYLARLRGTYQRYRRSDGLNPDWEFIHVPNITTTYGTLAS
jgi:hypothetical protein